MSVYVHGEQVGIVGLTPPPEVKYVKVTEAFSTDGVCVNAVDEPLIDMQISGNSVQANLPSEYQQVEYIEGTGTQYIDSGFHPDSNTAIEMDLFMKSDTSITDAKNNFVFGVSNASTHEKRFALNLFRKANATTLDVYPRFSTNAPSSGVSSMDFDKWYNIRLDKGTYYVDNVVVASYTSTFEKNEYPLYINAYNSYGSVNTSYIGNIKLRSCKIWDNTILARDLIPCYRKSDNVVGMYDVVNDVFYTNAGTGEFLKGNNAPTPEAPIEIESVGEKTNNLFDKSKAEDSYYISSTDGNLAWNANSLATDYIEVKPNTTYCMSENVAKHGAFYNANKEFVSGIIYTSIINVPDDASIKYFRGSATKTLKDTLQIVEGSQITDYEPYGYKVPVKVSGKNLFDYTKWTNANLVTLDGKNCLEIKDGGQYNYTVNGDTSTAYTFTFKVYRDSENTSKITNIKTSDNRVIQPNIRHDTLYSVVVYGGETIYFSGWSMLLYIDLSIAQIELGETATEYTPYIEPTTTNIYLTEPLRKIGNYADYIDYKNKKVVRNISEKVLDGTENWKTSTNYYNETSNAFYLAVDELNPKFKYGVLSIISNRFKNTGEHIWNNSNTEDGICGYNGNLYYDFFIRIKNDIIGSTENVSSDNITYFKTWLSVNKPIINYVLETPTEETIDIPEIKLHNGDAIIDVDTSIKPSETSYRYWKEIGG